MFFIVQPLPPPDYTRELEVKHKGKSYCFCVGPLVDDGATRTFFVSCSESLKLLFAFPSPLLQHACHCLVQLAS